MADGYEPDEPRFYDSLEEVDLAMHFSLSWDITLTYNPRTGDFDVRRGRIESMETTAIITVQSDGCHTTSLSSQAFQVQGGQIAAAQTTTTLTVKSNITNNIYKIIRDPSGVYKHHPWWPCRINPRR